MAELGLNGEPLPTETELAAQDAWLLANWTDGRQGRVNLTTEEAQQAYIVVDNDPRIPVPQDAVMAEVQRERDELRKEIEGLRAENDGLIEITTKPGGLYEEIERLHEVEHRCASQIDSLLAENERLKKAEAWVADAWIPKHWTENCRAAEEVAGLRAELKRLRAALRQILEDPDARVLDSHRDDGWEALK